MISSVSNDSTKRLPVTRRANLQADMFASNACSLRPADVAVFEFRRKLIRYPAFTKAVQAIERCHLATPAVRDLRVICACVRHRQWLIDMCQKCGCTLDWRRQQLVRCGCGNDLTRGVRSDLEPPESVLVFTKALEDWLRNDLPFAEERSRGFQRFMEDWLVADSIQLFQSAERYVRRYDGEQMKQLSSTENHGFDMRAVLTMSYVASGRREVLQAERC